MIHRIGQKMNDFEQCVVTNCPWGHPHKLQFLLDYCRKTDIIKSVLGASLDPRLLGKILTRRVFSLREEICNGRKESMEKPAAAAAAKLAQANSKAEAKAEAKRAKKEKKASK